MSSAWAHFAEETSSTLSLTRTHAEEMQDFKDFLRTQLTEPLNQLPWSRRFFCVLIGVLGGISPVPMITTAVTVALARIVGLTTPEIGVASGVNVLLTPLQILFMPIFANASLLLKQLVGATAGDEQMPSVKLIALLDEGADVSTLIAGAGSIIMAATLPWALLTALCIFVARPFVAFAALRDAKEQQQLQQQQTDDDGSGKDKRGSAKAAAAVPQKA